MMRVWVALAALLTLGLTACDNGSDFECSEEVPCEGFGEICIDGACTVEDCTSNLDCPMEHTCGGGGTCQVGCDNDNDCYPGNLCNLETGTCEEQGCTDTQIDCGYKEFCNKATGDCYDAGNVYCRPCDPQNVIADCNGGDGDGQNQCWNNYCTVDCSNGRECPSGFQCYPFVDRSGNVIAFQCLTYCWLYEDMSAGSEAVPPPPPRDHGALPWETLTGQQQCDPSTLLPPPAIERGDG